MTTRGRSSSTRVVEASLGTAEAEQAARRDKAEPARIHPSEAEHSRMARECPNLPERART